MTEIQEQPQDASAKASGPGAIGPKVLVICQVGMTGKTTVAANLLLPRLGGRLFSVDSVNQDAATQYGAEVEAIYTGELFEMRQEIERTASPVVVDLGASDFSVFIDVMAANNMARMFDYCVIVTDTSRRAQEEAISTYNTLRKVGMPAACFRVVLNKAKQSRPIPNQYPVLFAYKRHHPEFPLNENCYLPEIQVFRALQEAGMSYKEALADKTDYHALVHKADLAGDLNGATDYANKKIAQDLAFHARAYFDSAFKELAIQPTR
ncbi:MAG TPA: hypothetical protein VJU59_50675 [Paraburkholderia sp.]|jgi:MinD-like ATPase involved in chromosome partitioning or flagellar assembly|uniref:hypothetical protein n=1 Tax=Paraburkholderia sp. TaxID=1926495 RepID=UPI002B48E646|nr:hypothetical protein [Paraburkholderia sp.]HKR47851.1 hypothetical protein [Paraburkholderia sp.]